MPMLIRAESSADFAAIRVVQEAAFPSPLEADLVDQLRADGDCVIALVSIEGDAVVGHVMFSLMQAPFRALGLGPVAVLPDWQRQGVGTRLIEAGLARARSAGWGAVIVLGEPGYYHRFGFSAARAEGFTSTYAGPYLMALALNGDDLRVSTGRLDYAPAFATLG